MLWPVCWRTPFVGPLTAFFFFHLPGTAYFGFPIELCAEYKGGEDLAPRTPTIYLQVNSLDSWQRRRIEV